MFLNLTVAQFLAAFGAIAGVSVLLYLLDRTRRKQVVSTLRFWVVPGLPSPVMRTRKISQPISLLMQLLGMLLLLLALADFQWGGASAARRNHVLILDSSAWMRARVPGAANGAAAATLMDRARANAIAWLRAVPPLDHVMVIRADALSTPVTSWETNHVNIARAILETNPGATAINLRESIDFARELQKQAGSAGEIVYDGPGRITAGEADGGALGAVAGLRHLVVTDSSENMGLRNVGARRAGDGWDLLVRAHNYGGSQRSGNVTLNVGGAPQGTSPITIPANSDQQITFTIHTHAAGVAEIRLYPQDAFAADNYAALELPEERSLHVTVYSDSPDELRPALESDARVVAEFRKTAAYTPGNDGLIILHRFHPPAPPRGDALWIDPPTGSPIAIKDRVGFPTGLHWAQDHPLTTGLREHDLEIPSTSTLEAGGNDIKVAEVDKGTVIAARVSADGKQRTLVMGFDPFSGSTRYQLATPLLLANTLRWFAPGVFREVGVGAQSAGNVSDNFTAPENSEVRVTTSSGINLPFNIHAGKIQFFSGAATRVTVTSANTERVYSLTLPEMWDEKWTAPAGIRRGIPAWNDSIRRSLVLWPWLALAGAALLLAEYLLYGRETSALLRVVRSRVTRGKDRAA